MKQPPPLTDQIIRRIREAREAGASYAEIMRRFDLSENRVREACRGMERARLEVRC